MARTPTSGALQTLVDSSSEGGDCRCGPDAIGTRSQRLRARGPASHPSALTSNSLACHAVRAACRPQPSYPARAREPPSLPCSTSPASSRSSLTSRPRPVSPARSRRCSPLCAGPQTPARAIVGGSLAEMGVRAPPDQIAVTAANPRARCLAAAQRSADTEGLSTDSADYSAQAADEPSCRSSRGRHKRRLRVSRNELTCEAGYLMTPVRRAPLGPPATSQWRYTRSSLPFGTEPCPLGKIVPRSKRPCI
jgi:hypothetical protein